MCFYPKDHDAYSGHRKRRQGIGVKTLKAAAQAVCLVACLAANAWAEETPPAPATAPPVAEASPPVAEASPPAVEASPAAPPNFEAPKPTWDQAENIRAAAEHLGKLQRTRGAKGAYDYIGECYKTHGLAETYAAAFEACIAQDVMQTQVLALIYSRMSPDQLKKLGSPSAQQLAESMGRRLVSAFTQYKIPVSYVKDFKGLVDKHGFPVFLAIVFPNAKIPTSPVPGDNDGVPQQDNKPTDKP